MKKAITACLVSSGLLLMGCEHMGPKQTIGTIGGGAAGALIGSQIGGGSGRVVATGVGAVLGSMAGGAIGRQLDERDRMLSRETADRTLESAPDQTTNTWRNPNTGNHGRSTVGHTYQRGQEPCRTLTTVTYDHNGAEIGSEKRTYCRDRYGHWRPE